MLRQHRQSRIARPIGGFRVSARPPSRRGYGGARTETFGAADGRFVLEDVAAGEYVVEVTSPDRSPGVVSGVNVAAGGGADVGTVRLAAGGTVRGAVVDAGSGPVAGATVSVSGPGRDFSRLPLQATTDAGGVFELAGITPGATQVWASHPSYSQSVPTAVDVDPGRGPAEVRIVLGQGGRIEGHVRARDGNFPAGALVSVHPRVRTSVAPGSAFQAVAPDGSFAVEHVPAGNVFVALMAGRDDQYSNVAEVDAIVREGETTAVELVVRSIVITGRVTRAGVPLAGARVEFNSPHGGVMYSGAPIPGASTPPNVGITREDGAYQLTVGEPGETWVQIQTPDRKGYLPAPEVRVPDADTYVADFNFGGVAVDGTVVDRDTEHPIAGAGVWAQSAKPTATGPGGGGTETDAQGRFHLEMDPGEYRLVARAEGYGGDPVPITVAEGGSSGVRVGLVQGLIIAGRLIDVSGHTVAGARVSASTGQGASRSVTTTMTMADGSFQLSGLRESPYLLLAGVESGLSL